MTLETLKEQILSGTLDSKLIIIKDPEGFISDQYIRHLKSKQDLTFVESLDEIVGESFSIFGFASLAQQSSLTVYKTEVLRWGDIDPSKLSQAIIVTTKFEDKAKEKELADYIVSIPKLLDWQIKDFAFSTTEGLKDKDLEWLVNLCGSNIFRLAQELDKLSLFNKEERKYLFSDMIHDGAFDDLSTYSIFNFTNAITSKNLTQLKSVYRELDRVDVSEFGLLSILLKNFRNILMVQLSSNPTPENTGLDGKQLYAIKKIPRVFSPEQLTKIFQFLSDIDRQIKTGELPTEILIDYIVVKIFSM